MLNLNLVKSLGVCVAITAGTGLLAGGASYAACKLIDKVEKKHELAKLKKRKKELEAEMEEELRKLEEILGEKVVIVGGKVFKKVQE